MSLQHYTTKKEHDDLISHFGKDKVTRVYQVLETYIKLWQITEVSLIHYYSVNILFNVTLVSGQTAILKIHGQVDCYTLREIDMLSLELPLYCKLLNFNAEDGILLLEKAEGASLHHIDDLNTRLNVFIEVFTQIHLPLIDESDNRFPSYLDLLRNIKEWAFMKQKKEWLTFIDEAISYYNELKQIYMKQTYLHGDLHHDNVLYKHKHHPVVIDPKGVMDCEIYDIPRFILNELEQNVISTEKEKIFNIINYLSHKLNFSYVHMAKAFCIESILSITWTLQDCIDDVDLEDYVAEHLYCRQFMFM